MIKNDKRYQRDQVKADVGVSKENPGTGTPLESLVAGQAPYEDIDVAMADSPQPGTGTPLESLVSGQAPYEDIDVAMADSPPQQTGVPLVDLFNSDDPIFQLDLPRNAHAETATDKDKQRPKDANNKDKTGTTRKTATGKDATKKAGMPLEHLVDLEDPKYQADRILDTQAKAARGNDKQYRGNAPSSPQSTTKAASPGAVDSTSGKEKKSTNAGRETSKESGGGVKEYLLMAKDLAVKYAGIAQVNAQYYGALGLVLFKEYGAIGWTHLKAFTQSTYHYTKLYGGIGLIKAKAFARYSYSKVQSAKDATLANIKQRMHAKKEEKTSKANS